MNDQTAASAASNNKRVQQIMDNRNREEKFKAIEQLVTTSYRIFRKNILILSSMFHRLRQSEKANQLEEIFLAYYKKMQKQLKSSKINMELMGCFQQDFDHIWKIQREKMISLVGNLNKLEAQISLFMIQHDPPSQMISIKLIYSDLFPMVDYKIIFLVFIVLSRARQFHQTLASHILLEQQVQHYEIRASTNGINNCLRESWMISDDVPAEVIKDQTGIIYFIQIKMMEVPLISSSEAENKSQPEKLKYFYKASTFSKLFFSWISVLVSYGNNNDIKQQNLEDLKMEDRAEVVFQDWQSVWNSEKNKEGAVTPLRESIKKTFTNRFIIGCILDFIAISLTIMTPVLIYLISYYLMEDEKSVGEGIMWLIVVSLVRFFRTFFQGHAGYRLTVLGSDIGNTMALAMVKKSLKYSVLCNKKFKMGELANLLQVDCFRLSLFPKNLSSVITIIYVLIFSMVYLGFLVQASFLAGFGVIVIAGIINMIISRKNAVYQKGIADGTDNRMKATNEVFNNIKFIKVNAWQQNFYDKLQRLRGIEVGQYRKKFNIETISTFSMWLAPKMILAATFGTFVMSNSDNQLTPPIGFSVMSLFAYVQFYLQFLPNSLSVVIETANAISRIERFLLADEINLSCISHTRFQFNDEKEAVIVEDGNFYWDKSSEQVQRIIPDNSYHLRDLSFRIKKGEMVAIIGDIGAGKSSLIYSLLGEMKFPTNQNRPKVTIKGSMSLVTQKPWIVNDTVRNNIIFGKEYNRRKYQEVIYYASLKRDFELFTHGDKTMIGQKGATLSGGQKARISFARALYSESDILLLDDLLSAVDVHVGKFMMTETLLKYVREKTRILVTHALYYLKYVDKVLIMQGGTIVEQGTYEKIKNSARFRQIYETMMKDEKRKKSGSVDLLEDAEQSQEQKKEQKKQEVKEQQKSVKSTSNLSHLKEKANKEQANVKVEEEAVNELMMAQQSSGSDASWGLYKTYAQYNGGNVWILGIFFSMFGWMIFNTVFNMWLSEWTGDLDGIHSNSYYLSYYILFGCMYGLFAFFRAIIMAISSPRMSDIIHESMMSNLLFSPLNEFFDRVPLGRILNRLSKDLNSVDATLAVLFSNVLVFLFFLIGNVIIMVQTASAWILIPVAAYLIGITLLKGYYMKPNRELVRLEGITKSPVVSCFSEILNGVATIRAYGVEDSFFVRNYIKVNENKKPTVAKKAAQVWFVIRLTGLSFIINVTALSVVLFTNIAQPADATLLLVVSLALDEIAYFYLTNLSAFENQLISLQRCQTFMHLTPEKGYRDYLTNREVSKIKSLERRKVEFKSEWPDKGQIKFIDYKVKYRPNLDLVLRGLTVTFQGGHKIGVVGRTGSGKSTIMMSLLRILQAYEGQIIVDGKDIAKLSLDDLRSKITIILQDPCLFAGTLRENLDPLDQYSDTRLLQALELTALKQTMEERKGLETEITENGENLSVGQRQLISIARAILKPTKIVLVDEATANIDVKTEAVIYKAMNESFKNSTVITVAHRLNTVINSDRILVLEGGLLKQYDNPQVLLKNPNSFFASLYNESQKQSKM